MTGLPRLPEPPFRRAVPTTPADRAGARVDCFPAHAAFPKWQEGQPPHCHFRGLLRLHSRYGPPDRSATQGDLCHEAPAQPVTQPSRSSASGPIDNYPGGILLHRCFTPSGRTATNRLVQCSIGLGRMLTTPHRATPPRCVARFWGWGWWRSMSNAVGGCEDNGFQSNRAPRSPFSCGDSIGHPAMPWR